MKLAGAVLTDTGPLVALFDRRDHNHQRCRSVIDSLRDPLLTVWPVVVEAVHLLGGPPAARSLLEMIEEGTLRLAVLDENDAPRMRELMIKYADLPMDLADAALVRVAEREKILRILTIDADFSLYRPIHARNFEVIP